MHTIDMFTGQVGLLVVLVAVFLVAVAIAQAPLPTPLRVLIIVGLFLRVAGAMTRLVFLVDYYGGGDAMSYYREGLLFAQFFQALDWEPITNSQYWGISEDWWGTTFVNWVSGFVIAFLGPSLLGEFIVFSMFAFVGLVAFLIAFRRSFPAVPATRYARWLMLFPSLWFWPSSIGKESVIIMGLGLAVLGFVGGGRRIHWITLLIGAAIVFAARIQLGALFFLAVVLTYWLGSGRRWTAKKTVEGLVVAAVSSVVVLWGLRSTGLESLDVSGMQDYVSSESGRTSMGDSAFEAPEVGLTGVPIAIVNVLFRPYPWEADSIPVLASSLELALLWGWAFLRRKRLIQSLRGWRSSRLLCLSAIFIVLYSASFGMMVGNLGIIARQRVLMFPFLFIFLEAIVPRARAVAGRPRAAMPGRQLADSSPGATGWPVPAPDAPGHSSSR